jgi:threonine dehydrogenase-like Zn-dependent dehydrogenase
VGYESCVCGSDLWYYRGESPHSAGSIGHEFIGIVEQALLGDVLDGTINPGRVFDYETDLDHIADAYRAMDERRAIKSGAVHRLPARAQRPRRHQRSRARVQGRAMT